MEIEGPLKGVKVLEWSLWQQAPVAGVMLGDLGAEVIKIESPTGDAARGLRDAYGTESFVGGRHVQFEAWNRNKKSIALDLSKPKAREVVYRLVGESDVFLTNYRSGAARRLGLDYDSLLKYNPKLIYASGSAYGAHGPEADAPAFDLVGQARSAIMTTSGEASQGAVTPLTGGFADQAGAIMLAFGVVTALLARERLGIGQEVNASLLGAVMYLQYSNLSTLLLSGREYERRQRSKASNPLWNWYRCKDGKYILMGLLQPDRHWSQFCRVLNIANVEKEPRFVNLESRRANSEELVRILDEIFATKTCHEWDEIFKCEDLPHSLIQSLPDLLTDPQVLANKYIVDFHHPQLGPIRLCGLPVQFSTTSVDIRLPAPEFGQHTEEILLDHGYAWEQIEQLREEGAICLQ